MITMPKPLEPLPPDVFDGDFVDERLRLWNSEFPGSHDVGNVIIGRILRLHDIILKRIGKTLARHNLSYPGYAVLATLRVAGDPYQMSPSALQESLLLSSGGLSNLLLKMEQLGYVTRSSSESDGRGVIVRLTSAGRQIIEPAMFDHAAVERQMTSRLSSKEQTLVASALKRIAT